MSKASKVAPSILNGCTKISFSIFFDWFWNSGPSGLTAISLIFEGDFAKAPGLTTLMAPMTDMDLVMTRWQEKDETSSRKVEPDEQRWIIDNMAIMQNMIFDSVFEVDSVIRK